MKLSDCKPGVRVAVKCGGKVVKTGVISVVRADGFIQIGNEVLDAYLAWPENLRRLKPKRKVEYKSLGWVNVCPRNARPILHTNKEDSRIAACKHCDRTVEVFEKVEVKE